MKVGKLEILLIEDDPSEVDLIREMLSGAGLPEVSLHHVRFLGEGLSLLQNQRFDLVLVNLGLPDSRGLETALTVRRQARRTPVIALTSLDDEEVALKSLQLDIQDYLIKDEITAPLLSRAIRYAIQRKRDSELLREVEDRFTSFMLHLPVAAWMKDLQGHYVYVNAEAERIFSRSMPEMQGKTDKEIFPPDTARQFSENDERVRSGGSSLRTIEFLRQADGLEHHSMVTKFAVPGPDGEPAYVAGVAFDITDRKRAEEEVERLNAELRARACELEHFASFPLLDPTPIIEIDSDGEVIFCNNAAETALGKSECLASSNPLIPEDLPDILSDLRQKKVQKFCRTVEMGDLIYDELIYLAPKFNSVRIYAMEVTERRRMEEDRSRLAAIVESSGYAIIAKTLDGIIVDWNKGAEKLYGYTASEIKGRNIATLLPTDRVDEEPELLAKIGRGESVEPVEAVRMAKDGRLVPVLLSISPIKDKHGTIIGASTIAHDITDRKRAEQALRESEQKLKNVVEHSTNLFYMHDTGHVLMYVSPQTRNFFDCEPDEALGKWTDFITDNPVNRLAIEATQRAIDTGECQPPYQAECVGRKGRKLWVEVHEAPLVEGGRTVAVVGSLTDITDRKKAEEKIERLNADLAERAAELALANMDLEAFNYTVAHDLRQPLNLLSTCCQAIQMLCGEYLQQQEECLGYVQKAHKVVLRMNDIIEALLNYSCIGRVELRPELFDLSLLANEVAMELKQTDPKRQVDFRIAKGIPVKADAHLMRLALDNLIGNAWKYTSMRDKAVIEIGVTDVDGVPTYFVRDNGRGFDRSCTDKLFAPFQRLPGAEEHKGFGIGLATVAGIIRRHGGKVWAEGEPDKGAEFYFTLPEDGGIRHENPDS